MNQKFYCYVDETGQDTSGEFFLVSVVIVGYKRDDLRTILRDIEKQSGKGIKKWTKATRVQRKKYIEKIIQLDCFANSILFSHYSNSRSYVDLTILSTAKSILTVVKDSYEAVVYIDGLHRNSRSAVAAGLRKLQIHVAHVRGLKDEADEFIRLADSIAGFVRDALEGDCESLSFYSRAKRNRIIVEV